MKRFRDQRGQAFVMTAISLFVLVGMAALVLDVGHWYRSKRDLQAVADAAALAGAQALPGNTGQANALAVQYAHDNNGPAPLVSFSSKYFADDTITVKVSRNEQGIFANMFSHGSVVVGSHAVARATAPAAARWVAPIVVNENNPMLGCNPPPCNGQAQLDLVDLHKPGSGNAAGSFALLDLRYGSGGNPGQSDLADWMANGYNELMPLGTYFAAPSVDFNGNSFQSAVADHIQIGDEVLFPVYRPPIVGGGSGAKFNIVGWVGFVISKVDLSGSTGKLTGHFVEYIADGLPAVSGGHPNFGARVIQLVE